MKNYFLILSKFDSILKGYIYKSIYKVLFLTVLYGLFELLGITILIPTVKAIFSNEQFIFFGYEIEFEVIYILSFLFFLVKFIFNDQYIKYYYNFIFYINKELHSNFFSRIEKSDYINIINSNKNSLKSIISNEIDSVTHLFFMPFLQLISDFILIAILFIPLIYMGFYPVLIASSTLLLLYLSYKHLYSAKFIEFGNLRRLSVRKKNSLFSDFLAFLKNVKINKIKLFNVGLNNSAEESAKLSIKLHRSQSNIKAGIEFVVVSIILIFSYYLISHKENFNDLSYVFIFYTLIALRISPVYSRSISHINNLKFSVGTCEGLISNFQRFNFSRVNSKVSMIKKSWNTIEYKDIFFRFPNKKSEIGPFNLKIQKGKTYCILGPSGSGKTTLVNIIAGLLKPESGSIIVDKKPYNLNFNFFPNEVFYLSQDTLILSDTLRANITLDKNFPRKGDKFLLGLLKSVNLTSVSLDDHLNIGKKDLSGGEKQKINIARALYLEPKILILDEPTSSLDKESEFSAIKLILKSSKIATVILVTHNNFLAKYFDYIIKIKKN
jgi:ABC-type transport system involved in cytochrome bd biosynthesis fused ATPase/permease subunit